jgi:hypothetical protein
MQMAGEDTSPRWHYGPFCNLIAPSRCRVSVYKTYIAGRLVATGRELYGAALAPGNGDDVLEAHQTAVRTCFQPSVDFISPSLTYNVDDPMQSGRTGIGAVSRGAAEDECPFPASGN